MYLNAKQIKKLAEHALGITIKENGLGVSDEELEDFEFKLEQNVEVQDDDGNTKQHKLVVKCDGCDPNEVNIID